MKILTYEFLGSNWKFNKIHLQNINLIVGDSGAGKTRLLNTIFNLGTYVAQGKLGAGLLDYSASGHVPAGDSYVSSAYREMQEELGIDPRLEYLTQGLIENDDLETQEFIRIRHNLALFRGFYENRFELQKKEFKLQKEEVESIELYSLDKLKEIMGKNPEKLTEGFKVGINYLLEKNES